MKVILLRDVRNVGKKNEVKNVSDGFARNYLMARGLAKIATEGEVKKIKDELVAKAEHDAARRLELAKIARELKNRKLEIKVKAGDKGEIFGSVAAKDILKALKDAGCAARGINLDKPIKSLGEHEVDIDLGLGVKEKIAVKVVKL